MIAADSQIGVPSCTIIGTLPFGFRRRYSGVCVPPFCRSTRIFSHGTPSSPITSSVIVAVLIGE